MNKIIDFHHTLEEILQSIYCSEEMTRALTHTYSADSDVGPTIADNPVVGYDFAVNWAAGYGFADNWAAGYGVVGVLIVGEALPMSRSSFTVYILINTSMCYIYFRK
jgi:uncharacterized membrane protein